MRARLGQCRTELLGEFLGGRGPGGGHPESGGDGDEVDIGPAQIQQGPGFLAGTESTDASEFQLQNRGGMVVEDDDGDVELFALLMDYLGSTSKITYCSAEPCQSRCSS